MSLLILALGWKVRSAAVIFISSMGWAVCGLMVYQEMDAALPMILLIFIAIAQIFILDKGDKS